LDYESDSVFPVNKTGRDSEIRNMLRHGKVTQVLCDKTQVCVRVQYLDKDGLISKPLPVKQFGSRSTSSFWCPKVGDDVSVTMLPNGDEDGFVDGSFYNTGNPPPITDPNTRHITFADGTIIEYAETGSTFTFKSSGPLNINCGTATITCSGQATIKASTIVLDATDVKITGKLWVDQMKPYAAGEIMSNPHVKNFDGSGNGS
jgi:phage baseplate assembly protein V